MAYGYKIKKEDKEWTLTSVPSMEWTPRGGRRKARAKVRQQERQRTLFSLTMATGIFASPFGVSEAAIVPKDAADSNKITVNGNVYDISPQGTNGGFSYNRFSEFDLAQGQIANMKFDTAILANLVQNKININGIVNAVKAGQIDGHLMFLSPNGIAVGPKGVINAGQFTGIVPTQTAFDKLYNSANPGADITATAIENLTTYANDKSIDIEGHINTHSGVMLGAGIINIKDGAQIQSTKNLNFTDLVNVEGASAGLNSLVASTGSGGDIILTAKQESVVKDIKTEKDESGNDKEKANPIRWSDRSTDLTAAVNIGKGVSITSGEGAVKLTAESTSTYEDSTPMTLTDTLKGIVLGDDNKLLNDMVDKLAGKEAGANKYLFVNYSSKKNKSSVKIGENSIIKGNTIDIAATSKVEITQSITVPTGENKKDSEGKTVPSGSKAVAAVAVSRVYNTADVVIDGNLTATGADAESGNGIKISANADTKAELSATGSGGTGNAVAIGVAVLTGDTKSKITVNSPANATALTANNGKVSVAADTKSNIGIKVGAVGNNSYVVSSVGVANYDSSADVNINRSITAGAVDIKAGNNIAGLKMTVDNAVKPATDNSKGKDTAEASDADKQKDDDAANAEKNKSDAEKSEDEKKSEQKSKDPVQVLKDASADANDEKTKDAAGSDGKGGVQDVKDKLEGSNNGGGNAAKTSAFGVGASVGVFATQNDANVAIGKNAVITATKPESAETPDGPVSISAKNMMTASAEKEDSLNFTVKNAQANSAKVEIGAAVLVSNVQNNAKILLDNEGDKSAQIKGGAVSLEAKAGMDKYEKTGENNQTEEKTSMLSYGVSSEGAADKDKPATVVLEGSVGINTQKNNAIILLGQQSRVEGASVNLSAGAETNVKGDYGAKEDNGNVGIGATVGLQNISGNSMIASGKGAVISGTDSVTAAANNSLTGKNEVKNAGKGDSFGVSGMVALSYGDSSSIVALDDESQITAPAVAITAINSTNLDNSARSTVEGKESSKAFGIGVGIINYDVNSIAMVGDNGKGISAPAGSATDAEKAAQKIYQDAALAQHILGETLTAKLGQKTAANAEKGTIVTNSLTASAMTTGSLQNDAKAKVVSKAAEDKSEDANSRKDSEKWTQWSKKGKEGADEAKEKTENLEQDKVEAQNESAAPTVAGKNKAQNNASEAAGEAGQAANPEGTPKNDGAAPTAGSAKSAGASIGIEGSVALSFLGGRTDAVLDNVTVRNEAESAAAPVASVSLSATDFLNTITTGGTDIRNSVKSGNSATKVGIGGTFAMNSVNRDVDSILQNSDIRQVVSVANSASKVGIEVAAGMGVTASKGNGTNVAGAGAVYYNRVKQDIHALMLGNTITGTENSTLANKATGTDFQIAGGLAANSASGDNTNVGVGGAVAISNLENNLFSGIIGGSYQNLKTVDVEAQKGTTQINGALAATYAGGESGYGFEGAFAYGSVKNTTRAYISGATGNGIKAESVNVKAGEIAVPDAANSQEQANKVLLTEKGIDTTGKSYLDMGTAESSLDEDNKNTAEGKAADYAAADENAAKDELGRNKSLTINAAVAGGWSGKAGVGAGISYNYVKNDIAADIKDSDITADTVNGEAATDAQIISVGAGVAIGGKSFNGAGSGSWNDLKNDTKVTFENNTITGKNISEKAQSEASIINIAGEVAGGKGMAIGLSLAYNSLNNTTGTYLKGNTITLQGTDNSVKLASTNQSKALAVAGGVDANISESNFGAVGTVAINRGANSTESVIDGKTTGENTTLDNVQELSVTAEELTKKTTVAGSVSVGGKKVGIGGAVAYTSVGSSGNEEKLRAEINHADITTTANGTIEVATKDSQTEGENTNKSRVITVGAGFGVSWGKNYFNLQGAAAVSDIYKDNYALLNNTNINKNSTANHPTITVTADTMSKINTVGAVGGVQVGTAVSGVAGVAINRMKQDTKAEMATDGAATTVNAGLTQVRATGDGDIHSVGVGGNVSVSGQVAFAGSGSYNYIGNDVDANIKNQNLTANSSVGIVARSDDNIYNFSGGFTIGANTKAALSSSVSINKITGKTNALVQGGSVTAADTGSIKVTRPKDDKLFTMDTANLTTNSAELSASRQEVAKTGVVVDSSATHTLISQLASGGVAASGSAGVSLAGTVNLNTIEGRTTAKIQDANINSADQDSDVHVNAVDYANLGTFTGTPSVGAAGTAGVSLGVSANWETMDRTTEAEISSAAAKKNVYAKNLTVAAVNKHGSSNVAWAGAAGVAATAGVASGDSIVRHKNNSTTTATLKNVNAVFADTAKIQAEHLGNSHTKNIAASLAGGYAAVAVGAGVSVMDDTSTVKAKVSDSSLKAKESTNGKNISVTANNKNNWNNTLVTASLAVGLGGALAANVGINNTTSETAALVTGSQLEAYDVKVKAEDELNVKATGGVGAGGIGGVGVAVTLNNLNSSVSAHMTGSSSAKAANDIDIAAEEKRNVDSQVTGVGAGGIGVGVNVAVTSINKGMTDAQLSSAKDENEEGTGVNKTTQDEINKHLKSVNGAQGSLGISGAKFAGLSATDSDLAAARNTSVSLATPDTKTMGIHTEVAGSTLTAGNNVNVKAMDTSDVFAKNVGVTAAGAASVNVTDAIIHTNYDTDVTMNNATVTGKDVNISAKQTQGTPQDGKQGSDVRVTAVTVGALGGVGVGYAGIVNRGATDVDIANSTISGTENVTVSALDESKHKSDILSVGVAAANVTTTFASVENRSNVGVTLGGTNNISAGQKITIDAKKANTLEAHTQGVGVGGVNVAVNHATIEDGGKDGNRDTGIAAAKITGTNGTFTANSFHFGATNDTKANLSAGNTAVSVLGISTMRGKGVMEMGADVRVAGGTFNARTVEFASTLGSANGRTIEGNVKGHNISLGAVAPDTVRLETTAKGNVNVVNSTFGENTDLILNNDSFVDRKGYIYDVTVGGIAVGNSRSIIKGDETLTTTLTGKNGITNKLNSLQVLTYGENKGKAFADAGGGGLVGYVGAHVENKSTNKVTSTLGGNWDVKGGVYLIAGQKDEAKLTASEGHGGVIAVGGTSVDNTINTTTNANVTSDTVINADRVHISTSNAVTTGAYDDTDSKGNYDKQTYTLKDHFGGVIAGNRLRSLLDVTENGTVTIGKNAKITSNNLQQYIAASDNDLTNLASAKGGGAMAVVDAVSENKINVHNTVDVQSGAILSNEKSAAKEGIVLSAYDNQSLKSHAESTVGGVANGLVSIIDTTMNRKSDVKVAGTIESGSNVGLYAGANEDGALSNLKADLKAGTYNYAVFAVTGPQAKYAITADKGTVDVSGTVRSVGDINAIASGGREEVVKDQSLWNWVNGGSSTEKKFLTSDATTAEEALPKGSTVNVTGSLIAGTADPINLTIGGSVAKGLTVTADNNRANNRVLAGVTQGTFDYANSLAARWAELNKLIAAYDGDNAANGGTDVMAAYIAERQRIQEDMVRLGFVQKDSAGNYVYTSSGRPVYYVEIPDIATSGGNINVTANHFDGTGSLRANSAPSVTITNNSDAYLRLNNIIMGEQGGKITYNGIDNVIPPNVSQGNAKINSINVGKSGAAFREIYGVTDGEAANLLVNNTKTFASESDKTSTILVTEEKKRQMRQEVENDTTLSAADKTQLLNEINNYNSFTYTAIPDVEVNGKISNFHGNVTINNNGGDIRISGGTQERPTGVMGNTVRLTAAKGTISQGYTEGIVNINGNPEMYLDSYTSYTDNPLVTAAENSMNYKEITFLGMKFKVRDTNSNKSGSATTTYERPDSAHEATGYIAGRDVYVSAANINVNGLIQSGYKNYTATVTEAQLAAARTRSADRGVVVQNRTMYKVNDGGAKWNDTENVFDYVPQVYWDPATDKLVVEDIDTAGGKVYLTGKIASTGDGRILAADGAADITVKNETALDMNVGKILNNQREGVITIADTAKNTWTEYKRGQTRSIDNYSEYLKAHAADGDPYASATVEANTLSAGNVLTYTPQANQTYNWTKGKTIDSTKTYLHHKRYGLWGAVETKDATELRGEASVIKEAPNKEYGLPEGAVIRQNSDTNLGENTLRLETTSNLLENKITNVERWEQKTGFLGWFRNYYTRWDEGTKTLQTYNYSINASKNISIGLLGAEVGSINLSSTNASGGSINLTDMVANSHNEAPLNVSSAAGGITQFDNTTLKSEIVNLTAKNDIKNIHLASIGTAAKDANGNVTSVNDTIKLSAISTGNGDIDITAVGGVLENRSLPGNVEIVALKSQDGNAAFSKAADLGDVTLTANGNITQSGNGITVEGRGINLTSKNGGIGTADQAVTIVGSDLVYATDRYGAQVNANANGDIYLTEAAAGGDMRVGKIESREGDVTLTLANGGFIDGLPGDDKSGSLDSVDEMVHRWIDAGLIAGENGYEGAYIRELKKNRDDYRERITNEYTEYKNKESAVNTVFASQDYQNYVNGTGDYAELTDAQKLSKLAANGHQDYLTYKDYATADEYLQTTDGYKYKDYNSADTYLAADTKYQDLKNKAENPTYEWTKDMMLYAVSDKLVNKDSGSSIQTERAANVLGKNITLNATKGVGTFSDTATMITVDQLTGNDKIQYMKQLMNVGASDVTAKKDAEGNLTAFEIKGNMPLGVRATGTLNVQAGGNVSVAGRKDENGEHSALNVGTVDATQNSATGDVRLHSELGIYNNLADANGTNITGKNLILTGGKESIGTSDKPLTISLSGDMTEARADKNMFIKNMKDSDYLRLGTMYAKDTISLTSDKGFLMSNANEEIAQSYINAGKVLAFNTNAESGIVGNAANAIRILNDRAPVNITAKSAYIKGVNNTDVRNGTLVLGTVTTQDEFVAASEGSLAVGREEEKDKEAVAGAITAGGNVTITAAENLTLDGAVTAVDSQNAKKNLTLTATNGSITQTDKGAITANEVKTFNGKSLLLENAENKFNSITVDGTPTEAEEKPAIAGDVRIKDNADALSVAIRRDVAGDISVTNLRENGSLANVGNLTATGNIALSAQGTLSQAAGTTFAADKDVNLNSAAADIKQAADAGIKATKVTAVSAKTVDLQGTGNQFNVLAVQSSDKNAPIQGSVSVLDNADKLEISVQSTVNGDITVENKKANGVLQVSSDLQAKGDGVDAKGDITLKSDGSMQTDKKITATNDVKLTSTAGDVSIRGDVSTGMQMPTNIDFSNGTLTGEYNSLAIHAGGAIQEAAGVNITTPVVKTYSGKGVSLESVKNGFSALLAEALAGRTDINGSVKAVTGCDDAFTIGVGASIRGDAEFTNLHQDGELGILILEPENGEKIEVLGSDDAEGNLVLRASKDVSLLGDVNVNHDIVIDSNQGGSFYGLGKGMKAGNDVSVSTGDKVSYVGTIEAGKDIRIQVQNADSENGESGIYIGTVPDGGSSSANNTSLKAGNQAMFSVNGNGDISLFGSIGVENGAAIVNVSNKGNIFIGQVDPSNPKTITAKKDVSLKTNEGSIFVIKSINSEDENVSVETGKGDVFIGLDNVTDDETIKAKKNATIGTGLGTVYILGKTITDTGDITMKAGKETYQEGTGNSNFIIRDDGQLLSGGNIGLYGRNGDIEITDDIQANKGITVNIAEQGNVDFGRDVSVTENVDISTDKGNITVDQTVNSDNGNIRLESGNGNILVGKDITAEKDITISTRQGNVTVGDTNTGDDGDILSKAGNVSIKTEKGNIGIVKTVTAQEGSLGIISGQGDILIGSNGPDVKTVTAKQNIDLAAKDGRVVVYGKTSTEVGDISIAARKQAYTSGKDNSSFIIDQNGKLEAGSAIHLNVGNGDLHVSDRIQAQKDLVTELSEKGSLYFDTDVDVAGSVSVKTVEGDIYVGHDVQASKDIAMVTGKGNINVGAAVAAAEGNVNLAVDQGDIAIGKEVRAEKGSIDAQVGTGNVIIGNNGPDVETVTAQENINMSVDVGQIKIYGKTSTKLGDISMAAGATQYTPGAQNFIIEQNGLLESGRDISLTGRNGDLHVTDAIQAKRDLYTQVREEGGVFFDKTATLTGDVTVHTEDGQISIGGRVDANLVDLATGKGDIYVGGDIASDTTVTIETGTGDINLQNIISQDDIKVTAQNGNIHANNIISGETTHVALTNGDLFLNLAEGKAVLLRMENNTEASKVNQVLAEAGGGTTPDVTLTGNFIQIGSIAAKSGDGVFQLSAMGAGNQKLIRENFSVESLRSRYGTQMPYLWSNRGYLHVDEGDVAMEDVLAVDKIHLDNEQTNLAVYGRTPTRDGEQLVYWNNLGMAYSKERSFQLYMNGMLRTRGTVLIDAERNYGKLYGDNLSVVDMMRERVTNKHGKFTFDSVLLTEPGIAMKKVFFDMSPVEADFQQKNAAHEEIVVD